MKKSIFIAALVLIAGFLCACENIENPGQGLSDNSVGSATVQSNNSTANDSNDSEVTDSSQDFWTQPDDIVYPYYFETYEELIEAFSKENTESIIQVEKAIWGEEFNQFVEAMSQNDTLKLPYVYGELLKIRNKGTKISVFKQERYDLPWIWFQGEINERMVRVLMTYPTHIAVEDGLNASEILKLICPDAPNLHNYGSGYDKVCLTEMNLKDRTVSAIVFDIKDYEKNYITFYYDGFWIEIYTDYAIDDNDFWGTFELSSFIEKK